MQTLEREIMSSWLERAKPQLTRTQASKGLRGAKDRGLECGLCLTSVHMDQFSSGWKWFFLSHSYHSVFMRPPLVSRKYCSVVTFFCHLNCQMVSTKRVCVSVAQLSSQEFDLR